MKPHKLIIFSGLIITAVLSIYTVDLSIANFIAQLHLSTANPHKLLGVYSIITSEDFLETIVFIILILFVIVLYTQKMTGIYRILMFLIIGLWMTIQIKTMLKFTFGRCIPHVWLNHKCHLGAGLYPFNWLAGVNREGSFPSGHCVIITYCLVWINYFIPRKRLLSLLFLLLTIMLLILFQFHFLSDCFAGIALGYGSASITLALYTKYLLKNIAD